MPDDNTTPAHQFGYGGHATDPGQSAPADREGPAGGDETGGLTEVQVARMIAEYGDLRATVNGAQYANAAALARVIMAAAKPRLAAIPAPDTALRGLGKRVAALAESAESGGTEFTRGAAWAYGMVAELLAALAADDGTGQ